MIAQSALEEARDHLAVALQQSFRIDDPITVQHMRDAYGILVIVAQLQREPAQVPA